MTTATEMKPWDRVKAALEDAKGICWDGCHKIYVLLDDEQVAVSKGYGYDVLSVAELGVDAALATLQQWYADSCGLRFVESVKTVDGDPNEGYVNLIAQFADV